ncbi:ba3-type terminal oxidase subunit CbaD [Haloferax sp. CBA1150]|uniref:ba3-type terminal oxidase subunit CbaD n=1 Tax=Haloferax sp. CBA1150 TaxID=2650754 RepID=UPI001245E7A0|nr:ba3-type terminal oxidase subunit CbaD [Haloferax sp. CBA1150]
MAVDSTAEGSAASPALRADGSGGVPADAATQNSSSEPPVDSIVGTADDGIVRQIDHDDFDPVGTLVLVLIYMVILLSMWVFMYFIEFLGRGLTVVG